MDSETGDLSDVRTAVGAMEQLSFQPGQEHAALRRWMLCLYVSGVDLVGIYLIDSASFATSMWMLIELVYPPDTPFSTSDLSTLCFHSFPERHDSEWTNDIYFSFAMRNDSPDIGLNSPAPPYGSTDLLFGVSVFRQEYDGMKKRRYNQKSLVIISNHDFTPFFMNVLRVVASDGVISDIPRLEAACAQIEAWQAPKAGLQSLPFFGNILKLEIPPYPSFPLQGLSSSLSACSALLNEISASEPPEHWQVLLKFLPSPKALYLLYERALLGQSIIILGQDPQHTSALVHAIVDLIRPVPFSGIVRPYVPMQGVGADMALFDPASHTKTSSLSMIVGITNPFLLQRVSRAANPPYILALNVQQTGTSSEASVPVARQVSLHRRAGHRVSSVMSVGSSTQSVPKLTRIDVPGSPIASQARPTRFLKTDYKFLDAVAQPGNAVSSTVRMHFAHLTARILAPINLSLATQSTSNSKASSTSAAAAAAAAELPRIATPHVLLASHKLQKSSARAKPAAFAADAPAPSDSASSAVATFLARLPRDDQAGGAFTGQTGRGRQKAREEFYAVFCRGANFTAWLEDVAGWVGKKAEAGVLG